MDRDELIALIEAAIVPESKWRNRDSAEAQKQLGECWAQLQAQCEFTARPDDRRPTETILVNVFAKGFTAFEYGGGMKSYDCEMYYVPTRERLERNAGGDWY